MVGLLHQNSDGEPHREIELTHEIEFAVEASRSVIEQCFALASLILDVDAVGVSILDKDQIWHFHDASEKIDSIGLQGTDVGFSIAIGDDPISSFHNADTSGVSLKALGEREAAMRFFAGCKLVSANGDAIGAMWIGQSSNRVLSDEDCKQLTHLAGILSVEFQCHLTELATPAGGKTTTKSSLAESLDDSNSAEILTICSWTKRINESGEWIDFEDFIQRRLGISVTHGISDEPFAEMNSKLDRLAMQGKLS